jgi:Domain of unknown function (DUF4955)/Pectate lyase superfamily protein
MKNLFLTSLVLLAAVVQLFAQENNSELFRAFQNKSENSILPDFSYAGYHCGEKEIPTRTNYKIFDVTAFGAIPNDTLSDKVAIQKAIDAANQNGSGIVFFPKGRFLVNVKNDSPNPIASRGGNIILRGSGSGVNGTELFMGVTLQPEDPTKMWTVPYLFQMKGTGTDKKIGDVSESSSIGSLALTLTATDGLKEKDWISLKMQSNAPELIREAVTGRLIDSTWTFLLTKGVVIQVFYQVVSVNRNTILLQAPISYPVDPKYKWEVYKFAHIEEVGVEDLAFVGNWKSAFVHHRSWQDDSGYSLLQFIGCTNSWMKNCRFTDCNAGAVTKRCANMTISDCMVDGNPGHNAISAHGSTNILLSNLTDNAGMWHSFGVAESSMNTVIRKCKYPKNTCFESHSSQPRNTLLDEVEGGLLNNRGGGANVNMPNHLTGLVFWNYTQTNEAFQEFEFWPVKPWYWRVPNPIIVGFMSKGTTFKNDQLGAYESPGRIADPASLYQAQLQLRMNIKKQRRDE